MSKSVAELHEESQRGPRGTLPIFLSDVEARQGELTADSLQLTASVGCEARDTSEPLAVSRRPMAKHDLPKAKTLHVWADG
jgi:hypothetical protein